jgi:hypothetical protein
MCLRAGRWPAHTSLAIEKEMGSTVRFVYFGG